MIFDIIFHLLTFEVIIMFPFSSLPNQSSNLLKNIANSLGANI